MYQALEHSQPKGWVILDGSPFFKKDGVKDTAMYLVLDRPRSYQLVGEVMAHQGNDG